MISIQQMPNSTTTTPKMMMPAPLRRTRTTCASSTGQKNKVLQQNVKNSAQLLQIQTISPSKEECLLFSVSKQKLKKNQYAPTRIIQLKTFFIKDFFLQCSLFTILAEQ